jgi:hypothetical protein
MKRRGVIIRRRRGQTHLVTSSHKLSQRSLELTVVSGSLGRFDNQVRLLAMERKFRQIKASEDCESKPHSRILSSNFLFVA